LFICEEKRALKKKYTSKFRKQNFNLRRPKVKKNPSMGNTMEDLQTHRINKLRGSYGEFDNHETYMDAKKKFDRYRGKVLIYGNKELVSSVPWKNFYGSAKNLPQTNQ